MSCDYETDKKLVVPKEKNRTPQSEIRFDLRGHSVVQRSSEDPNFINLRNNVLHQQNYLSI